MVSIADVRNGTQGALRVLTPGDVVVFTYSFTADGGHLGIVRGDTQDAGNVYWFDAARAKVATLRLTDINPQIDTWKLPQISLVTWKSPDGADVEGILELPPDCTAAKGPLPMVVELHGGPTDATLCYLQYWIYGRTLFPAKGYALLSPNYRGSTGYGDKFLTDLVGHENDIEVKDILAGVDAMVAQGIADPERLGVMGWSNGGFLVNCLITTTDAVQGGQQRAPASCDQLMQWGLEDTPGHVINYMRGLPWERTEAYMKASPAYEHWQSHDADDHPCGCVRRACAGSPLPHVVPGPEGVHESTDRPADLPRCRARAVDFRPPQGQARLGCRVVRPLLARERRERQVWRRMTRRRTPSGTALAPGPHCGQRPLTGGSRRVML